LGLRDRRALARIAPIIGSLAMCRTPFALTLIIGDFARSVPPAKP